MTNGMKNPMPKRAPSAEYESMLGASFSPRNTNTPGPMSNQSTPNPPKSLRTALPQPGTGHLPAIARAVDVFMRQLADQLPCDRRTGGGFRSGVSGAIR